MGIHILGSLNASKTHETKKVEYAVVQAACCRPGKYPVITLLERTVKSGGCIGDALQCVSGVVVQSKTMSPDTKTPPLAFS